MATAESARPARYHGAPRPGNGAGTAQGQTGIPQSLRPPSGRPPESRARLLPSSGAESALFPSLQKSALSGKRYVPLRDKASFRRACAPRKACLPCREGKAGCEKLAKETSRAPSRAARGLASFAGGNIDHAPEILRKEAPTLREPSTPALPSKGFRQKGAGQKAPALRPGTIRAGNGRNSQAAASPSAIVPPKSATRAACPA